MAVNELIELLRALARHEHSDDSIAEEAADALEAMQMGLRYAVRVWVLSDEIAWSEEEIDEVVESIIDDAKKEAGND
jgi:predicted nucleic-acid-binding protein